jgi:hypothetical protein
MISTILAFLGPVAGLLAQVIEKKFGPKTGDTKRDTLFQMLKVILEKAGTAGKFTEPWKEADLLAAIEQVVQEQKKAGTLGEQGTLSIGSKRYVVQIVSEIA